MIAYLSGSPILENNRLIIVVNGVGYRVSTGQKLLNKITSDITPNQTLNLHIYTHVKEDKLDLYGFDSLAELQLFELLLTVSGVGPSTSLAIVDNDSSQLVEAVQQAKISFFTAVPRVGKKLAQKIIIELKNKLGSIKELDLKPLSPLKRDVTDALLSLGFDEHRVEETLREINLEELDVQGAIKVAMKSLKL